VNGSAALGAIGLREGVESVGVGVEIRLANRKRTLQERVVAEALTSLGAIYDFQGRYDEAEP